MLKVVQRFVVVNAVVERLRCNVKLDHQVQVLPDKPVSFNLTAVARDRIELSTSRFSVARSYQLSYRANI